MLVSLDSGWHVMSIPIAWLHDNSAEEWSPIIFAKNNKQ